jgi:ribosome-associated toxin RatA of RatAB toxin-antitoxin module
MPGVADISRTRVVHASAAVLWDVLADFGALSSWAPNVDHSCIMQHTTTLLGTSRRVQVGRNTLVERVTECAAPNVLGYEIEGLPRRLGRASNRWTLTPAPLRGTTVTLTSSVDIGSGPLARLTERAVCRMMATQSEQMLDGLASRVKDR